MPWPRALALPPAARPAGCDKARIDRGKPCPKDQGLLTSEGAAFCEAVERAEPNRLRKEIRELGREKDFFRLAAAHVAIE
jgi:transposase